MLNPAIVANYFLQRAQEEGRAVTPMQLIKLVYIAHGWHLGYFDQPLINEPVQAWRYGPVVHSLYNHLRQYGRGAVSGPIQTGPLPWQHDANVPEGSRPLLDSVWKNYARFSGIELSRMTHQPGTPWSQAWHDQGGSSAYFAPISDDMIREHYRQRVQEAQATTVQ